ncbi:unnamed protein product [Nippostrongylus brasiliensis]|uniref:Uncharacterized protein n=1 Tax=Nippostrongylus brasiliensis TaxID=27835 RepID=A0A0N4XTS3_NIPBR|nr:unnamed protein product [Nippostrongylus brasiliensis]
MATSFTFRQSLGCLISFNQFGEFFEVFSMDELGDMFSRPMNGVPGGRSMSTHLSRNRRRLQLVFEEQEKAAKLASTATGFIMSICFFVLPVVWSSMFHLLPLSAPACAPSGFDPWSEFTDL